MQPSPRSGPILVTVWLLFAGLYVVRDLYAAHLHNSGRPGALVLLHPLATALKVLIIVLAGVIYLDKLGVNIATLLAGLGVGGIPYTIHDMSVEKMLVIKSAEL